MPTFAPRAIVMMLGSVVALAAGIVVVVVSIGRHSTFSLVAAFGGMLSVLGSTVACVATFMGERERRKRES